MHKITKLNNALTIVTERKPNMHSMALGFWINTGGRYEAKSLQGVSHFLEHILFKGTKKRNYKELKQAIEGVGGVFNAFTSEEHTCYYVKMLSEYLTVAVDILSDMVLRPLFDPKEINKERNVIIEELRMYLDLPNQYVDELLDEILWPNHPLGRSLLGTYHTIASIKRDDLIAYQQKYYTPPNIVVSACGNIEHDEVVALLSKEFKKIKKKKTTGFKKINKRAKNPKINFHHKATEQTHICMGVHALDRLDPNRYAQRILNVILGGNMSSRLFNEVREKRCLAYQIGSGIKEYMDTGALCVHAGVDNKKAIEAISVVIAELAKLKNRSVKPKELIEAKEYYKGHLLMSMEDTMSKMLSLGEQIASTGKILLEDEVLKRIEKIDLAQIKKIANKIFNNDSLSMSIIGPQEEKEKASITNKFKFKG